MEIFIDKQFVNNVMESPKDSYLLKSVRYVSWFFMCHVQPMYNYFQ